MYVKNNLKFAIAPIGFKNMLENSNIFVDKSLLIKDIINEDLSAILILRPRRWGKTINMHMLYNFFQP